MWSYYDWVYCCCPSVKTICGRIMIGFSLLSSVSKHNMWSYLLDLLLFRPSVNTISGRIMNGFCCCCPSVNTICGRIMIGLSLLSSVSKHNMWSYYDWVYCLFRQ